MGFTMLGVSPFYTVFITFLVIFASYSIPVKAEKIVGITERQTHVDVNLYGSWYRIARIQKNNNLLEGIFQKTSRPCPPYCIQPITAHRDVVTIGELELLQLYQTQIQNESALIIDVRELEWYLLGTLPGAGHMPLSLLTKVIKDKQLSLLKTFPGNTPTVHIKKIVADGSFEDPKYHLIVFGNGNWSPESFNAINILIDANYPASKISWYRGGVQNWVTSGFELVEAE